MTALAQRLIERKRDGGHVEPGEWRALTSACDDRVIVFLFGGRSEEEVNLQIGHVEAEV